MSELMVGSMLIELGKADLSYRVREMLESPQTSAGGDLDWPLVGRVIADQLSDRGYHFCWLHEVVPYLSDLDADLACKIEHVLGSQGHFRGSPSKRSLAAWYYGRRTATNRYYGLIWPKTEDFSVRWGRIGLPRSILLMCVYYWPMRLGRLLIKADGKAVAAYEQRAYWYFANFNRQDQHLQSKIEQILGTEVAFDSAEHLLRRRLELWQSGLVLDCERDRPTELCTRYEPTPERPLVAVEGEFVEAEVVRDGATLFLPVTLALRARIAE